MLSASATVATEMPQNHSVVQDQAAAPTVVANQSRQPILVRTKLSYAGMASKRRAEADKIKSDNASNIESEAK